MPRYCLAAAITFSMRCWSGVSCVGSDLPNLGGGLPTAGGFVADGLCVGSGEGDGDAAGEGVADGLGLGCVVGGVFPDLSPCWPFAPNVAPALMIGRHSATA